MARPVVLALVVAMLAPAALAASASAGAATHAAAGRTVALRNVAFSPSTTRIQRGQTVRFTWQDSGITHNVTPVGSRRFKLVAGGRAVSRASDRKKGTVSTAKFTRAGTYRYVCTIHATPDDDGSFPAGSMVGRIIVK